MWNITLENSNIILPFADSFKNNPKTLWTFNTTGQISFNLHFSTSAIKMPTAQKCSAHIKHVLPSRQLIHNWRATIVSFLRLPRGSSKETGPVILAVQCGWKGILRGTWTARGHSFILHTFIIKHCGRQMVNVE